MEFENKLGIEMLSEKEFLDDEINIRENIEKYFYYWRWFVMCILLGLALAYSYLRYSTPQFESSLTIWIDNKEGSGLTNELSAFEDLGFLGGSKSSMSDEIASLKSRPVMEEVVKDLGVYVSYFRKGQIRDEEYYKHQVPFHLKFVIPDSILHNLNTNFRITNKSTKSFWIEKGDKDGADYFKEEGFYEQNIKLDFGYINISSIKNEWIKLGETISVHVTPVKKVAKNYIQILKVIEPLNLKSSILTLKFMHPVKQKAEDILNNVVIQYNQEAIAYKSLLTNNTNDFINQRITDIYEELSIADQGVEEFKKENKLTDIDMQAEMNITSSTKVEEELANINGQIKLTDYVIDYLQSNTKEMIPMNLGLNDQSLNQVSLEYNQLLLERNRIVQNSTLRNPTVIAMDNQLESVRNNINVNLINLKSTLLVQLNEIQNKGYGLNAKRISAPSVEREFQDIKRKQVIIETLYLYLLEKREENAIALGAASPNAKVIDSADGPNAPVTPNHKKTYLIFAVIGFFIPFSIISIRLLLDNKIHSVEDVKKILEAPVLGDIPKTKSKQKIVVTEKDRDSIAEAFRLLRTNIKFMFSKNNQKSKTIFITSTIAGEGKTFITINLASVIASTGVKVLLIGADLRKPKLNKYLKIDFGKGLTHYLVDSNIEEVDLINRREEDNFDVIHSGEVPPNPSELLMNGRFKKLMTYSQQHYDYILVDTPPVSLVTDALLLSEYADLFVYVVRANYLDNRLLKPAQQLYTRKKLKNMAILVNATNYQKKGYGYGGYGYGYGEQQKRQWWRLLG